MELLRRLLEGTWEATLAAAPYIILGTIAAGLIHAFLRAERLRQWLAGCTWKSVLRAATIGVPLPLCSCSVLPVAMQLRRAGASKGATSAFLISTPESGVDSVILSIGILNPVFAAARVIGAFVSAMVAGLVQNRFGGAETALPAEPNAPHHCCASGCSADSTATTTKTLPIRTRLLRGQHYAFTDLLAGMAPAYAVGLIGAGAVMAFLPDGILERYTGGGILGMLMVAMIGLAVYICASASTPLAATLILKGMSPGTALVLLLAGPATSIASLLMVKQMLGGRGLLIYLGSVFGCAVAMGLALDALAATALVSMVVQHGAESEEHAGHLTIIFAAVLIGFIAFYGGRDILRRVRPGAPHAPAISEAEVPAPASPAKSSASR